MPKIKKYDNDLNISLLDRVLGTNADDDNKTCNYVLGDLVTFMMSQMSEYGFYKIGDYMVDRKGGANTTIETGNILYGVSEGGFAPNEYIIAVALQDNPTLESHVDFKYRG